MKKLVLLAIIAFLTAGAVFAQRAEKTRRHPPEAITVEGTLQLQNGMIAVAGGESVYFVPILFRYAGFIEGIKEGNSVSIEGFAFKNFLLPVKLAVGGKSYDFPAPGSFGHKQRHGFEQRRIERPPMPPMHRHGREQMHGRRR
jgi:hypothetical protein